MGRKAGNSGGKQKKRMKKGEGTETSTVKGGREGIDSSGEVKRKEKPKFRLVEDDTKPILRDPILRSDPIETEQAVLRLPPFSKP